jgi:site-specific recombinase XerD
MNRRRVTDLGAAVVQFFESYLPTQRGMSRHTIRGYRDAIVMLLQFVARRHGGGIETLDLVDLDAEVVEEFLRYLEVERHNGVATRNVRLAAIHTLARFLSGRHPDRLGTWQAIIAIPFKRGAQQRPPEHLAADAVKALLDAIDRSTASGQRDYALLVLLFNTGARVQEVLDLRVRDVRLDPPQQV